MWKNSKSGMLGLSDIGPNVPAFLVKLWKLVDDPKTDELICWSESGTSFIISAQAQFARELLPLYYKHNNMASFIRQLNMYGFHKIVSVEAGGLKSEKDEMEFAHQCFLKDRPYLLENIKRKLSNPKAGVVSSEEVLTSTTKSGLQCEVLAKVLSDVNNLKGKQESWDARLAAMKRENEALWRELAIFRQKHLKQEQIINKLIHFIVTIVQPSRNVPLRRRYPLMLNDIQPIKKISKLNSGDSSHVSVGSPTGPTIHEIDPNDAIFTTEPTDGTSNVEIITTELSEPTTTFAEVLSPASQSSAMNVSSAKVESPLGAENNISEWLEVDLSEGDLITNPLTPINPVEVNPAVAAATLMNMEAGSSVNTPISVTIPAIPNSDSSKTKPVIGKRTIYLTNGKTSEKSIPKKRGRKESNAKLEMGKKKLRVEDLDTEITSPTKLLLDLACETGETSGTSFSAPAARRKLSPSSTTTTTSAGKIRATFGKKGAAATSKDTLKGLECLYKDTIDACDLIDSETIMPEDSTADIILNMEGDESSTAEIPEYIDMTDIISKENEDETSNADPTLASGSSSMAVVCQPTGHDDFTWELSSHVDTVQGEIDYLKDVLKGEGYNLDANAILGLFANDPITFGMPPAADDDLRGKENGTGSELIAYGGPNLMDLVDLFGSSGNNQDWANVLSPSSPPSSELATPAPSPMPSFTNSGKRRKK